MKKQNMNERKQEAKAQEAAIVRRMQAGTEIAQAACKPCAEHAQAQKRKQEAEAEAKEATRTFEAAKAAYVQAMQEAEAARIEKACAKYASRKAASIDNAITSYAEAQKRKQEAQEAQEKQEAARKEAKAAYASYISAYAEAQEAEEAEKHAFYAFAFAALKEAEAMQADCAREKAAFANAIMHEAQEAYAQAVQAEEAEKQEAARKQEAQKRKEAKAAREAEKAVKAQEEAEAARKEAEAQAEAEAQEKRQKYLIRTEEEAAKAKAEADAEAQEAYARSKKAQEKAEAEYLRYADIVRILEGKSGKDFGTLSEADLLNCLQYFFRFYAHNFTKGRIKKAEADAARSAIEAAKDASGNITLEADAAFVNIEHCKQNVDAFMRFCKEYEHDIKNHCVMRIMEKYNKADISLFAAFAASMCNAFGRQFDFAFHNSKYSAIAYENMIECNALAEEALRIDRKAASELRYSELQIAILQRIKEYAAKGKKQEACASRLRKVLFLCGYRQFTQEEAASLLKCKREVIARDILNLRNMCADILHDAKAEAK